MIALLAETVGVRPGTVPVTSSQIELLRSPGAMVYVDAVAPVIGWPLRTHCSEDTVSGRSHTTAVEDSVEPTWPEPETTAGVTATGPGPGLPVTAALVEEPVPNSGDVPVTTTVMEAFTSCAVTV